MHALHGKAIGYTTSFQTDQYMRLFADEQPQLLSALQKNRAFYTNSEKLVKLLRGQLLKCKALYTRIATSFSGWKKQLLPKVEAARGTCAIRSGYAVDHVLGCSCASPDLSLADSRPPSPSRSTASHRLVSSPFML